MTDQDNTAGTKVSEQRDSTETVRETAETLASQAKEATKSARDAITEEATQRTEAGKSAVADEISELGGALRKAADDLREGSPQERTFGQMAGALADLSDTVRDKDLGELVDDVSGFARRNPFAFLAGAALLGFAGTRLAKASRRNTRGSVDLRDYWDSDEHDDALEGHITNRAGGTYGQATTPGASPAMREPSRPATGVPTQKGKTS